MADDVEPFEVRVDTHSAYDHVQVTGHLDIYTTTQLRDVLSEPGSCTSPVLIIDLLRVAFMDSTGLGALVAARRQARARGADLRLVCERGAAFRVIRLTKLDTVLSVFSSLDEATAPKLA